MTGYGILENLISDIIFLILAIGLAWLWIFITQRRKLMDFFDVAQTRRLAIYLSNIRVMAFGAVGISGSKMSYKGEAVSNSEIQAAYKFQKLFSFIIPRLAETFKSIGALFLSDIEVQVQISPISASELDSQASIISLGSGAYNAASSFIEDAGKGIVKFRYGSMSIRDLQGPSPQQPGLAYSSTDPSFTDSGGTITPWPSGTFARPSSIPGQAIDSLPESPAIIVNGIPPILDSSYGFIQRVKDNNKRSLFYVAGMTEAATKGAAYQLATQWSRLYAKYGKDKPFLIMYRFDISDSNKCTVVFEKDFAH